MRVVIDDSGRASAGHKDEVNDCVCRASAIAAERPYQEIWDALKALMESEGPTKRSGVEELVQHKLMETLGWTWVATSKLHLREDELPSGRTRVVSIRQHSVAVVDGVIHDTHDCSLDEWKKPPHVYGYHKKGVSVHDTGRNMNNERKKLLG
jgi:hypothetical protein